MNCRFLLIILLFFQSFLSQIVFSQCTIGTNNGFEDPLRDESRYPFIYARLVSGWRSTAKDMEIVKTGFFGVRAYEGRQFAELNAQEESTLIKDFNAVMNRKITLSFAHRGRLGVDEMKVSVGPLGGPYVYLKNPLNGTEVFSDWVIWRLYKVQYTPLTTGPYELHFEAFSTATNDPTTGNFLDAVSPISDPIKIVLLNSRVTCDIDKVTLDATSSTDADFIKYTWYKDGIEITAANAAAMGVTVLEKLKIEVTKEGVYLIRALDKDYGCTNEKKFRLERAKPVAKITFPAVVGYCKGDANRFVTPTVEGNRNGRFSSDDPNLNIDPNTGMIDLEKSIAGKYRVTYTIPNTKFCGPVVNDLQVVLNTPFAVGIQAGRLGACEGATTFLEATATVDQDYTYQWFLDGDPLPQKNKIIEASKAGLYRVRVTNMFGCVEEITHQLNLVPDPKIDIEITYQCDQNTAALHAEYEKSPFTKISWFRILGDEQIFISENTDDVTVNESGIYVARVENATSCIYETHIPVFIKPKADFQVTQKQVCLGESVQVHSIFTEQIANWIWETSDGARYNHANNFNHTFTQVGKQWIKLRVLSVNGNCFDEKTIEVQVNEQPLNPTIVAGVLGACEGSTTTLRAEVDKPMGDYTYQWFLNGVSLNQTTQVIEVDKPGNYEVEITNASACSSRASFDLKQEAKPEFSILATLNCDAAILTAKYTKTPITTIKWFKKEADRWVLLEERSDQLSVAETGTYRLQLDNGTNCNYFEETEVLLNPKAQFKLNTNLLCLGQSFRVSDIVVENVNRWEWRMSDGTVFEKNQPFDYTFKTVGKHWVKLTVYKGGLCFDELTLPVEVKVTPVAIIGFDTQRNWMLDEAVEFQNLSTIALDDWDGVSYLWDFGDGTTSEERNPIAHVFPKTGIYNVKLVTTNAAGCSTETTERVEIFGYPKADF